MYMEAVILGAFGLIIGSFLNVVILRRGARSLGGRSGCMSCGHALTWYELLPVASWIYLRGRCRSCHAGISVQYPLVEAATAALFIAIGLAPVPYLARILGFAIAAFLVVIFVYDLRHTIIPDEWVWPFNAVAFLCGLSLLLFPVPSVADAGWLLASGPLTAFPLFALWFASRGTWMGFGDVKLALGIGWLLGAYLGLYAVFAAFIIGATVSVFVLLPIQYWRHALGGIRGITRFRSSYKRFTMKSEVPFGPFLIASTTAVWLMTFWNVSVPFFII